MEKDLRLGHVRLKRKALEVVETNGTGHFVNQGGDELEVFSYCGASVLLSHAGELVLT